MPPSPRKTASPTSTFTFLISVCFLSAALSSSLQYYGLLSPCGVTPLPGSGHVFFTDKAHLPYQLVTFIMVALSCVSTINHETRWVIIPLLTYLQLNLLAASTSSSSSPFYNFQWDNLLVEVGALASFIGVLGKVGGEMGLLAGTHLTRCAVQHSVREISTIKKLPQLTPSTITPTLAGCHYSSSCSCPAS